MSKRRNKAAQPPEAQPSATKVKDVGGLRPWIAIVILIAAVFGCYFRSLHQDFVTWDDQIHVFQNPYLVPLTSGNLGYFWTHPYEKLYIPISYTVFALLAEVARLAKPEAALTSTGALLNPHVFHAANIVLHAVNAILVYFILRRLVILFRGNGPAPAPAEASATLAPTVGALLFALHPLQVESVAWISELRGLLSALFTLKALICYLNASQQPPRKGGGASGPWKSPWYWVAIIMTVAALLAKPSAAALPLMLLVIDRWALRLSWREAAIKAAPFMVLVVPFLLVTHGAQPVPPQDIPPIWQRPFVAGDALAFYLAKLFAPVGLTIDYGRQPVPLMHTWYGYVTWLAPVAVGLVAYTFRKNAPWLVAACLLSLAYLLPVLGFVPFVFEDQSTVADRYVYLAMLGPALVLTLALSAGRPPAGLAVAGCWLIVLGALTVGQVRHWDDSGSLFSYAVAKDPDGAQIRTDYGLYLNDHGDVDGAMDQYRAAINADPYFPREYTDLGIALLEKGRTQDAVEMMSKGVSMEPDYPLARSNYGIALMQNRDLTGAAEQFDAAVSLDPNNAVWHSQYAGVLVMLGRTADGMAEYQKAVELDPRYLPAVEGLGDALARLGQNQDAIATLQRALAIDPNDQRAQRILASVQGIAQRESGKP